MLLDENKSKQRVSAVSALLKYLDHGQLWLRARPHQYLANSTLIDLH